MKTERKDEDMEGREEEKKRVAGGESNIFKWPLVEIF